MRRRICYDGRSDDIVQCFSPHYYFRRYFHHQLEFSERDVVYGFRCLEWRSGHERQQADWGPDGDRKFYAVVHGGGRHEQCNDVGDGNEWDDTSARRDAQRKSTERHDRQRRNSELECDQCNLVYGVGWLERREGDERQRLDRGAYGDDELRAELYRSGRSGLGHDDSDGDDSGASREAHGEPNNHRTGDRYHADLEFERSNLVRSLRRLEWCQGDEWQHFDRKPYRNHELYADLHWSRRQHGGNRGRHSHELKCSRDHAAIQRAHSLSEAAICGYCPGQRSGQVVCRRDIGRQCDRRNDQRERTLFAGERSRYAYDWRNQCCQFFTVGHGVGGRHGSCGCLHASR